MQEKLTLDDLVKKAEIDEQAVNGVQHFHMNMNDRESSMHKISEGITKKPFHRNKQFLQRNNHSASVSISQNQKPYTDSSYVCYRCAWKGHKSDVCYFRSATCNKCKKIGHIAVVYGRSRQSLRAETAKVHQVQEPYEVVPISSISEEIFKEYEIVNIASISIRDLKEKIFVELLVNGKPVLFEADSGSRYAIISIMLKAKFEKLNICKTVLPCKKILRAIQVILFLYWICNC